jgi:hypothetical protein
VSNSSRVVPAQLKPFKKGEDSRRNPLGRVSHARSTWMAQFLNSLAEKLTPEEAAEMFAKRYKSGIPFFVGEAHDRLGGKVSQPMTADMTVKGQVMFVMPRPEDKPHD